MIYVVYGSCRVSGDEGIYELGHWENTLEEIKDFFANKTKYTIGNGWELEILEWLPRKIEHITWFEGKQV